MKLRNENIRSYIDDIKQFGLLDLLTWKGNDVAASWIGPYEPATRSDDKDLHSLAKFNRDHYLFYRALVERHVEREGRILDIGCGNGSRTAMLARYAEFVLGIDSDMLKISAGAILNKAANIHWMFGEFLEWSNKNTDKFDYVFAVEVIEHVDLPSQRKFLLELIGKVKQGGALLMTTPRDRVIDRKPPHIGLWDDDLATMRAKDVKGELFYFNARQLDNGGENPWCEKESGTHFVLVAKP